MAKQIFISYSHDDERWRARLVEALAPWARAGEIDAWDDRQLTAGDDWAARIDAQIARSNVAVLLVSSSFLASQYVADVEMPQILAAAEQGRITLVWIPVSAAGWEATALAKFEAAIDPRRPLDRMSPARAREALVRAGRTIVAGRTLTDIGSAMHAVDAAYDALAGDVGPRRVVARQTPTSVAFEDQTTAATIEVITFKDLETLPEDEHRLVMALHEGMTEEFERWTMLRPRRGIMTSRERQEYQQAGRRMCSELNSLLDFIERRLGKHLQDHYHGIRYACDKLVSGVDS